MYYLPTHKLLTLLFYSMCLCVASATSRPTPMSPTKQNVLPAYDNAVPSVEWKSVSHADFAEGTKAEVPASAGAVSKRVSQAPTYYAWEGSASVRESESHSQFHYEPAVAIQHVKKSSDVTLEGIFSVPETKAPEPDVESSPCHDCCGENIDIQASNILGGTAHYSSKPESEYGSRFHYERITVEHVKKNADVTLEGVFNFIGSVQNVEKAVGATGVHTLDGVFTYVGVKNDFQSENRAAFASGATGPVEHVKKSTDVTLDGIFSSPEKTVVAPATEPAPVSEPAVQPEREAVSAVEQPPAPVVAPSPVADCASECECKTDIAAEAPITDSAVSDVSPASPRAAVKTPFVYESVATSSFTWPKTSPVVKPVPADGDFLGGATGPKPNTPVQEEAMQVTLEKQTDSRFTSEYRSKFHLPKANMNTRAIQAKQRVPDSLWVCGTKGVNNVLLKEPDRSEVKPKMPQGYAQVDHLRGSAAMPLASDTLMVFKTERDVVPPSKVSANDPMAGYIPGPQKNVLRSKDQPIPGQIPALREMSDPIAKFEKKPVTGPAKDYADPILMYRRYPMLSDKQANRFATTSRSSYKWVGQK